MPWSVNSDIGEGTQTTNQPRHNSVEENADPRLGLPSFCPGLQRFQDHALDVRIDIERGRPQKANQCLIAFPRKFGSERRRR